MGSLKPVLPEEGKRNILITSALPYVNNVPHLGNIIGSVLSADVFARYCKARGYNTLYVCGSDEYGTATETKALEEGLEPAALCAKYHVLHKDIYDWFRIGFDVFGRTPTAQQTQIVQQIFADLWKNDYIEERETVQPFCPTPGHSKFLADRFVEGDCSICGDSGARGDQCDACGSLLDAFEPEKEPNTGDDDHVEAQATGWLINPRCKLDGAAPEKRRTKHLFLKLDALKEELVAWFKKSSSEGEWSPNCTAVTQSWIDKGLLPRGISRDLKWGVPIPKGLEGLSDEEYANKVFYVWFDACIGYVSITKTYTDGDNLEGNNWEKWWRNPDNVKLYQFMGKDNIPFHTIIFPASQLGTRGTWTKVHKLSTTDYLNYEGGKFSKSKGVGVFGNTAKETGVDPDVWRYYLLSRRPESSDSEFKWQEFIDCNNNDLLKNLGNLNQRIVKFCQAKMDGIVPDYTKYTDERLEEHKKEVNEALVTYNSNLEAIKLRAGLATVMQISSLGNKLLQDSKLNNQLLAEEPERCAAVIGLGINHLQLLASILFPYMPSTAESILTQIGCPGLISVPETWSGDIVKPSQAIGEPKLLFSQIPASQIEQWREAFGGEEVRKQKALQAEKAAANKAAKERKKQQKLALRLKEGESSTAKKPVEASAPEKSTEAPAAEKK
ncbi:tRNA synthetases class I (M)-domain-containing protein [Dactylonectria estremocensis]|uniref:methionine--tRNA ligase n=1 Tax=Dactylonectria estremocensis TaxID=1079267 RepID=A0A9P9FBE3_9HYPO|nr:tRNA synthetases class I (M)-domain-containing protein [Dactylonectria estremocensis]